MDHFARGVQQVYQGAMGTADELGSNESIVVGAVNNHGLICVLALACDNRELFGLILMMSPVQGAMG